MCSILFLFWKCFKYFCSKSVEVYFHEDHENEDFLRLESISRNELRQTQVMWWSDSGYRQIDIWEGIPYRIIWISISTNFCIRLMHAMIKLTLFIDYRLFLCIHCSPKPTNLRPWFPIYLLLFWKLQLFVLVHLPKDWENLQCHLKLAKSTKPIYGKTWENPQTLGIWFTDISLDIVDNLAVIIMHQFSTKH